VGVASRESGGNASLIAHYLMKTSLIFIVMPSYSSLTGLNVTKDI
jgi:hypothetical protein